MKKPHIFKYDCSMMASKTVGHVLQLANDIANKLTEHSKKQAKKELAELRTMNADRKAAIKFSNAYRGGAAKRKEIYGK